MKAITTLWSRYLNWRNNPPARKPEIQKYNPSHDLDLDLTKPQPAGTFYGSAGGGAGA